MTECKACGDKPKKRVFPSAVVEINNPEQLVLLRKVVLPATLTEADNPPVVGKYRNVILQYEDTGHIYLYSSDGIPTAIESNVPQEVLDRIADLESDLAYETSTRQTVDTELGDRIDAVAEDLTAETTARQTADTNLQSQIDAITASSDVTDIVGTYAQLQAYDTSTLGDNDIIKVLQDESQNNETTYYRWNATTQQFTLIGEEGPYYTKSQADALLNAKQNTLTAGTGIDITNDVISATGGGGGPTVVQSTGTSTTDVMSQNATTAMVFADPNLNSKVQIGGTAGMSVGAAGVNIGYLSQATGGGAVTLGSYSKANAGSSVALGSYAETATVGVIEAGLTSSMAGNWGYNSSKYRLLTGLYDPQSAHDAATKGYVDTAVAGAGGANQISSTDWSALWQ